MAQLATSFPRKTASTCPRDILGMLQNSADAPRKRFATLTDARCVLAGCSRGLMTRNVGPQIGVARPTESVIHAHAHAHAPAPQIAGVSGCHSVVSHVMSGRSASQKCGIASSRNSGRNLRRGAVVPPRRTSRSPAADRAPSDLNPWCSPGWQCGRLIDLHAAGETGKLTHPGSGRNRRRRRGRRAVEPSERSRLTSSTRDSKTDSVNPSCCRAGAPEFIELRFAR